MTIGERIKHRREELGLSQEELAHKLGYKSRSSINKIELDSRQRAQKHIKAIADALNTTPSYIMGWDNEPPKQSAICIPVLGRIAAGTFTDSVSDIIDYTVIPESWHGDYFALKVRGSSMMPRIAEDDVLICKKQCEAESGDIVIAQEAHNDATVKKLVIMDNGISLQPFNPEYDPIFYTWEQKENLPVEILGKVVESRHKF